MNEFHTRLITMLKEDDRLTDQNGELVPAAITDRAWKLDEELVKTLLRDEEIKEEFFEKIEGHWIFHATKFVDYVGNKDFLDNSYTSFRNKIGLNIDGKFLRERGEVTLVWPYKDCVLEGGQTKDDQKRKEIFFNETLARDEIGPMFTPKALTGWQRYSAGDAENMRVGNLKRDADSVLQENMLIKGNNLIALHSLAKQFRDKVKLIYIDPPYNTKSAANTFAYNNNFNHSTWLTFMKNRLEIARHMLINDGILVVSIDHHELYYLGLLLDEIFGVENRMGVVSVVNNPAGRQDAKFFPTAHENMLFYANNIERVDLGRLPLTEDNAKSFNKSDIHGRYKVNGFTRRGDNTTRIDRPNLFYPIYYNNMTGRTSLERKSADDVEILPIDNNEVERCWRWGKDTFNQNKDKNIEIRKVGSGYSVYTKLYEDEYDGEKAKTIWNKSYYSGQTATQAIKALFGSRVFSYPKSPYVLRDVLEITTKPGDIVLDFFAGSGTTASVAHKMRRQWIAVEQMDYIEHLTVERLKKVLAGEQYGVSKSVGWKGGGDFLYYELAPYNQLFMDRIQAASSSDELLRVWADMSENSVLNWYANPENPDNALEDLKAVGEEPDGLEKQKRLLAELLDKSQLYVHKSEIADPDFNISDEDKELTRQFYDDDDDPDDS